MVIIIIIYNFKLFKYIAKKWLYNFYFNNKKNFKLYIYNLRDYIYNFDNYIYNLSNCIYNLKNYIYRLENVSANQKIVFLT